VARGTVDGADVLLVGATIDGDARVCDPAQAAQLDGGLAAEVLPLVGLALPYPDGSVGECRVLPPIQRLSERYRQVVLREAERVARRVVRSS
jgi:hypothetical protein